MKKIKEINIKPFFENVLKEFRPKLLTVFLFLIVFSSCNKEQQPLILDQEYQSVADLLQYCQGSCGETYAWENEGVLVKGYILNFDEDSIKTDYYNKGKFFLQDIRNGMFMEIRVTVNKDPVFEKIWPADNKDIFYIKGTAVPVTASDDGQCTKGVVISLVHPDDINYE